MDVPSPEIALLISSFQRPWHLARALASSAVQHGVDGRFEIVITDDGSQDETIAVVAQFAAEAPYSVKLTTHDHTAFQLARCRNEGAAVSSAPYLLFSDGDCVFPADHVRQHLQRRAANVVMAGDCCRLSQEVSERIDLAAIQGGEFPRWGTRDERRRLRRQYRKACFYRWIGHRTKPKLIGNNIGMWRADYVRINGFDEEFVGWGCEDDDLRLRLRRQGVQVRSILKWTCTYHLWHPPAPSCPRAWHDGPNVRYFHAIEQRPARCWKGLVDLTDQREAPCAVQQGAASTRRPPFAEVTFHPGHGQFSGRATWNVLVVEDRDILPLDRAATAHLVVGREAAATLMSQLITRAGVRVPVPAILPLERAA
ncbi:MAG: galactosyltransferase-related protein [Pirellulaceae bacterium]|jgi:glycosyltransferase involved in cell wall biosynthesis|nr:galactosyltransferase-related protein [Pirellulaceae bacterium]